MRLEELVHADELIKGEVSERGVGCQVELLCQHSGRHLFQEESADFLQAVNSFNRDEWCRTHLEMVERLVNERLRGVASNGVNADTGFNRP